MAMSDIKCHMPRTETERAETNVTVSLLPAIADEHITNLPPVPDSRSQSENLHAPVEQTRGIESRSLEHSPWVIPFLAKIPVLRELEKAAAIQQRELSEYKIPNHSLPPKIRDFIRYNGSTASPTIAAVFTTVLAIGGAVNIALSASGGASDLTVATTLGIFVASTSCAVVGLFGSYLRSLHRFLSATENPKIARGFEKYPYFFVDAHGNLHFTSYKPRYFKEPVLSTAHGVTGLTEGIRRLDEAIGTVLDHVYFRFGWPYVLGMTRLPFLGYASLGEKSDLRPGQKVLELACGAIPWHRVYTGKLGSEGSYVASDGHAGALHDCSRVSRALDLCSRILRLRGPKIEYQVINAEGELPFATASFDRVLASYIYAANVDEILRVLKPEGKLVISMGGAVGRYYGLDQAVAEGRVRTETLDGNVLIVEKVNRKDGGR